MRRYQEGGAIQLMEDPNNPGQTIFARIQGGQLVPLQAPGGQHFQAAQRLDPERGAMLARQLGQMQGAMSDADMESLRRAAEFAGVELGKSVATTGLQGTINALRQRMETQPLTNHQMSAMRKMGSDVEEIEAEQIERSYNTNGTGGRVVTHANGALEWVPNGPGDIPQPPVGDVFYDPIEELRMQQEAQGFARGGAVKRFQNGGLAEAAMPDEPDLPSEEDDEIVEGIVERTTGIRPGMSMSDIILQSKQENIKRLQDTRTNLAARREQARKREESDRWLAFAQAMLAPTRTGAFGESLGVAAGNLREERARSAEAEAAYDLQLQRLSEQEIAIESNMIDQMLKDAIGTNRAKGVHGSIQTMVHPEDQGRPVEEQRIVFGALMRDPDDPTSEMMLRPLENPDRPGELFEAASRLDPARANALIRATELAEQTTARSQEFINEGYGRRGVMRDVRNAIAILENADTIIETSGFQALKNRVAEFVGVDLGDTTELSQLQRAMARDFLARLESLKGPASDKDLAAMRGLSMGLGRNTDFNYQVLLEMRDIGQGALSRAIREAWYSAGDAVSAADRRSFMDTVGDLWSDVEGNRWVPGAVPVDSREDVEKLPVGAAYFREGDWGGIVYIKRGPTEE